MSTIEERIKQIIREQLAYNDQPTDPIENSAHLMHDLGFDSLNMVEAVMAVEDDFEIEISDEDGKKITTVQEAIDYVTAHATT